MKNGSFRRNRRREQAEARNILREKRTPEQQLAKLDKEGFKAQKERKKLLKQIEKNIKKENNEL